MKPLLPEDPWKEFGILGQYKFLRLMYNEVSKSLVAVMEDTDEDRPPLQRLYYRRLQDEKYSSVMARDILEDQRHAHFSASAPFLIYNEWRFIEHEPVPLPFLKGLPPQSKEKAWGGDWMGIRRFNLETGEDKRMLDRQKLNIPSCYVDGWVSEILSVSADGSHAVCKVGLNRGQRCSYFVYEVSLLEGLKREIAELPQIFL
jgi:hypothetical protein